MRIVLIVMCGCSSRTVNQNWFCAWHFLLPLEGALLFSFCHCTALPCYLFAQVACVILRSERGQHLSNLLYAGAHYRLKDLLQDRKSCRKSCRKSDQAGNLVQPPQLRTRATISRSQLASYMPNDRTI